MRKRANIAGILKLYFRNDDIQDIGSFMGILSI